MTGKELKALIPHDAGVVYLCFSDGYCPQVDASDIETDSSGDILIHVGDSDDDEEDEDDEEGGDGENDDEEDEEEIEIG